METRTGRWRRITGDLAAIAVLLIAVALLLVGAMTLAGLLGPACHL